MGDRTPPDGMALGLTDDELINLPSTVDFVTAARALGIGKTQAFALNKAGTFPVETFRVGRRTKVAKHKLLAYLGVPAA